ncbi:MAG: HlyD family efflux transporter periplasmic adaptor subunit [Pseudomonadota bacterium]
MNTDKQTGAHPLEEFIAARYRERLFAEAIGSPPKIMRSLAGLVILVLIVFGALLYFAPWVQTAAGNGAVVSLNPADRMQEINALVEGRIKQWFVRDGSILKEGDPILEISDIDPQFVERLNAERAAFAGSLEAARVATVTAKKNYDRQKQLHERGLSAQKDLEAAKIKYQQLLAKEAESRARLNKTDIGLSRQSSQIVRAPRAGRIVHITAGNTSTLVKAGDPIASFAPTDIERAVEVYLRGIDAPIVQTGQHARVMFEGWPAVQFSGWPEAAIGTFGGLVGSVDPVAQPDGTFRTLIYEDPTDPWPEDRYLRMGGKARVWVQLSAVRLGYELWRQLNRFPPKPSTTSVDK